MFAFWLHVGPGAYVVASADTVTKPRILSASFQSSKSDRCALKFVRFEATQSIDKFSLSTITESVGLAKRCKLVAYMHPVKPNYRTHEQKLKVRAILAARKRWTRLGLYDVSHACVERRIGATKIIPMTRQADNNKRSPHRHPVQLRKKVRMWRRHEAFETKPSSDKGVSKDPHKKPQAWKTEKDKTSYKTTEQWRRAQTRELLRVKALKARLTTNAADDQKPGASKKDSTMFMAAHAMSKQLGRDIVQCRRKKFKIVSLFSAQIKKEQGGPYESEPGGEAPASARANGKGGGGIVPFAKATGRDDLRANEHSVFLLGKETEQRHDVALNLDHINTLPRPRAPRALIGERNDDDERFPMTKKFAKAQESRSVLEPKFEIVEKSVVGHRFVRFEKQLDRPEFIPLSSKQLDNDVEQLEQPSKFPILEKLKFSGGNLGVVDYRTMQGREDVERLDRQQLVDVIYEPNHELKLTRAPAPVDMNKMLARATAIGEVNGDVAKDQVLCKLRENHDEIEKAMRLLSKFKRSDVGFVDIKKGYARFERVEVDNQVSEGFEEMRASRLEMSVLSSKARVDQTFVDMRKSLGRWKAKSDEPQALKPDQPQLILSPKDDVLSKRKRAVGLVDMKNQVPRPGFHHKASLFLDPTRDSATTRFLQRHTKI